MNRWWNPPGWRAYKNLPRSERWRIYFEMHRRMSPRESLRSVGWFLLPWIPLALLLAMLNDSSAMPSSRILRNGIIAAIGTIFILKWDGLVTRRILSSNLISILRETGYCTSCGYDLAGNTSGQCPECGEPVPPSDPS